MTRLAAAYARVSTDRQAERQTIQQQVQLLRAYAEQHELELGQDRIYQDDGHSGAKLDRPALDRLRDAVARGDVDVILITSPDRLARRYAYQVWLLEEFERAGCQIVFLERPPSDDPQDTLLIQIRGAVAEYERTVIADRMRRGRLAALKAGKILPWSTPPFGYKTDPRSPRDPAGVRLDEAEAQVIRSIFRWYVEDGLTLYGIARRLTDERVPTATGKWIWSSSAVRKILTNPTYQGTAYGNQKQMVPARRHYPLLRREPKGQVGESCRLRPEDDWIGVAVPAIVSEDQFQAARERISRNQLWATRNTKGQYLLRCLVSCGRCGLTHHVWNNGRYAYYRCAGMNTLIYRHRPEACHSRQVPTGRLDEAVWENLCQLLGEPSVLEEALHRTQEGWLDEGERVARCREVQRREAEVQRRIQRLVDAYEAEVLNLDELETRRRRLEDRLAELRREGQRLAAEGVREDQLRIVAARLEEFRAAVARGLDQADFTLKRALVELLIDRVVVDAPEVEIHYVIPITGAARRKGVLPSRHRATQPGGEAPDRRGGDLPQPGQRGPAGGGGAG